MLCLGYAGLTDNYDNNNDDGGDYRHHACAFVCWIALRLVVGGFGLASEVVSESRVDDGDDDGDDDDDDDDALCPIC